MRDRDIGDFIDDLALKIHRRKRPKRKKVCVTKKWLEELEEFLRLKEGEECGEYADKIAEVSQLRRSMLAVVTGNKLHDCGINVKSAAMTALDAVAAAARAAESGKVKPEHQRVSLPATHVFAMADTLMKLLQLQL